MKKSLLKEEKGVEGEYLGRLEAVLYHLQTTGDNVPLNLKEKSVKCTVAWAKRVQKQPKKYWD